MTMKTLAPDDVIKLRRMVDTDANTYMAFPPMTEMSKTKCTQPVFYDKDKFQCTRKYLDYAKEKGWGFQVYNLETGSIHTNEGDFTEPQMTAMIAVEHRRDDVKASLYGTDIWDARAYETGAIQACMETIKTFYPFVTKFEIIVI